MTIQGLTLMNGTATGQGGSILDVGAPLTLVNMVIGNNVSGGDAGAVFLKNANLNVQGSTFSDNVAGKDGGAVDAFADPAVTITTTISNTLFAHNRADGDGGALRSQGNTQLTNVTFDSNTAGNDGGGLFLRGFALTLTNSNVSGNVAKQDGGGAYNFDSGSVGAGSTTIANSTINNNAADSGDGGGLNAGGAIQLQVGAKIDGNRAGNKGGGVFSHTPQIAIQDAEVVRNSAPTGNPDVQVLTSSGVPLSAEELYVQTLYLNTLGRTGTKGDYDGWVSVLSSSGATAVAAGVARSPEGAAHLIGNLYLTYLGRPVDAMGVASWAPTIEAGGTVEAVTAGILGSAEFATRANALIGGDNPNANYVQAVFQLVLLRAPSGPELTAGQSAVSSSGRSAFALGILQGNEYRTLVVTDLYFSDLKRPLAPSMSELNGWTNANLDLLTIQTLIEGAPESVQKNGA